MPELGENHAALSVHRLGNSLPAFDLLRAVDPGRPGISLASRLDLNAFRHHEPCTGTLLVVGRHYGVWNIARLRAARACQRWQHDAVT